MYILTSHLISVYSGKPYIDFVKERIFTPLNMTTTTFSESEALQTGLLAHSFNAVGRRLPFWFPDTVKVLNAGAGGVISSAHDLVWPFVTEHSVLLTYDVTDQMGANAS